MFNHIESFFHIHETCVYITVVSCKMVDAFDYHPRAHVGAASFLITELKVVKCKLIFKKRQHYPVEYLQDDTTQCNRSIVVTGLDISLFIFHKWHNCAKQQDITYVAMDQEHFDDIGYVIVE